ncbi:CAP domain-containing protein [Deinococcus multiflagellatus]|uniref:CAP domain-containing protein n=1 Tax=Deinococcus multiflagellatus TaxID=1656887 RepID=A0ABW1ZPK4_9DEIO
MRVRHWCQNGVSPAGALTFEGHLQRAAEWHAQDMRDRAYIAHQAPAPAPYGADPIDRVLRAGYQPPKGFRNGENLALGYRNPQEVVQAWLDSKQGHCETLARKDYVDIGVAAVDNFWALEVASPL